ncbi:anaerobic ribonucleoside-triphosphate reductase activating protein [Aliiglaciecola sp. CAU 1673]|uniref:anaerobic ribonucleoside-triphosphate reductase activating protein n=1 Tax=Aliiglaciecola sp. CAU 1673 TaxID=3032595 RepID=UPI0023DC01FE|nr:anaerobic ribonucleoside-triphosphate reductase activating protein [Aliiglaciecola sp. CAU 1673]MDF2177415.1 anaerobic ribonucleoside-triphosphate reductase activating protein [Aliiglaciecola sp. CAU 1673]
MRSKPFNSFPPQVCFQEVPDEVSLAFTIFGCPLRCPGCHSQDSWDPQAGQPLSDERFGHYLQRYRHLITCVLFFGGEWHLEALEAKLDLAKGLDLKTCLYTGLERVPQRLLRRLDYLKTGAWQAHLGGLQSTVTNQRFVALATGNLLNFRFRENNHAAA